MALWNDLSRKVADTKDKTVQQAKVLGETQKLNAVIAEEKKKIEACYRELGMQYAQMHHEDYEAAFSGVMGAILASEKLIRESQAKIRDIRGIRCCEKCGAELAKDAAFCSGCGAVVPKPVAPAGKFCTGCGAQLAEGMRFCTSCGTPVPVMEEPVMYTPVAAEPSFVPPVLYRGEPQPAAEEYIAQPQPIAEEYIAQPQPAAEEYIAQPQPVAEEYIAQPQSATENYFAQEPVAENHFADGYFPQSVVMDEPRCPLCNAVLEEGAAFCTSCGCRMI